MEWLNNYAFLKERLCLRGDPLAVFYSSEPPEDGLTVKKGIIPSSGTISKDFDWSSAFNNLFCVLNGINKARRKRIPFYFSQKNIGCVGGAFYLGFLPKMPDFIAHYISCGFKNMEGERYLKTPQDSQSFFEAARPPEAPRPYLVVLPLERLTGDYVPDLVLFLERPEVISGLVILAQRVTADWDIVRAPFGAGCTTAIGWPFIYKQRGQIKAFLGGFDSSARPYLRVDELTFSIPWSLFLRMLADGKESFLITHTWQGIRKRIILSQKRWGKK